MKFNVITHFFPVPSFLKTTAIGFDLSNESVKFVGLKKKKGKFIVTTYGEEKFPLGTIEVGKIKDRKNLVSILTKVCTVHKFKNAIVSLPEEKSYIFNLKVPYVNPKELYSSVELQLEEHIPLPIENIIFDFDVISYIKKNNELLLNIAVLPKDVIDTYLEIFEESKLRPIIIDPEAIAIGRAVVPNGDMGTYILVDFGQGRTSISIYQDGYIRFNTILNFGGIDITRAIMKNFKLNFDEAEKMKIEKGIERTEEKENNVFTSAVTALAVLKDEIQKYYSFWNEKAQKKQDDAKKIEKIFFSGGGSALIGFPEFMSTYMNTPLEIANPWVNIFDTEKKIPPISKNDSLRYTTAIGLALNSIKHNE